MFNKITGFIKKVSKAKDLDDTEKEIVQEISVKLPQKM